MGKASQFGALGNMVKNNEKLQYASENFSRKEFRRIHKAYKRAKWSQSLLPILFVVVVLAEWIFLPSEDVPHGYAGFKETVILFESAFFVFPLFPFWLILCNFTFGNEWRKYNNWYKKTFGR